MSDPTKWKFDPERWFYPDVKKLECSFCHHEHDIDTEDFVVYYGNVTVGIGGGMIGNNIDNGKVVRVSIICRDSGCHENLLKAICPDLFEDE